MGRELYKTRKGKAGGVEKSLSISRQNNLTPIMPRQARGFYCLLLFFILQAECAPPVDATPWSLWELGLTTEQGT
ncbi:MAG: Uncharacterised protein [Prochlorococcus marinus str. MIT 9215]|nr:MAG: Uncharacterised protein [Prochlorococcus marinus str. MIT 9215]